MRIVVDEMPESCAECIFSKCGSHQDEAAYTCFCGLNRKEKLLYEWETMKGCPLIDFRTAKNMRLR